MFDAQNMIETKYNKQLDKIRYNNDIINTYDIKIVLKYAQLQIMWSK